MAGFTCYWSSLELYEGCPQGFLWNKGWGLIDLGRGPGKKKLKPVRKSEHHAVMGTVIQAAIERFYNDELWRTIPPEQLMDKLMELADESYKLELARRFIDWRLSDSRDEMEQVIKDGIRGYVRTMKAHRLLGPYSRAEVDLVGYVDERTPVGGRADLIIRREIEPYRGVTILDGKNGKRYKDGRGGWMTFTDPDQLRWYALCFWLVHKKYPDRLGFVYYRYPYGQPVMDPHGFPTDKTEEGVTWVPFTKEDVEGLAQRAVDARKGMDAEMFPAKPDPKRCRFCDYETVCPERQAQREGNRRNPSPLRNPTTDEMKQRSEASGIELEIL